MKNPLEQLKSYWKLAHRRKDPVADNIYLATVDSKGDPHVRTVLLKTLDRDGIGFVTNRVGRKVEQLKNHRIVEGCMAWSKLSLQVRFSGKVKPMSKKILQQFWKKRPREAQLLYSLGIPQSSVLPSFEYLLNRVGDLAVQKRHQKEIPLSSNYIGFIVQPKVVEFLYYARTRLSRRECFTKVGRVWHQSILAP